MVRRIPFVPVPIEIAKRISRPLIGLASKLEHALPELEVQLKQAEIEIDVKEYLNIAIFTSIFWLFLTLPLLLLIGRIYLLEKLMIIGPLVSIAISVLSFLYILLYPRLLAVRRIRSVERNLLYALRHMAVQVKAGVTLFDSLVYISKKDYGVISEEFAKCTKRISTGTPTTEALDEIALRNPSLPFRRSIWQLSNSMRAGVDIGNTLESMVKNLSDEHRVAIRTYGSQLSPLTMMYMMLAVIIPSLGITFLVILGSFSGILISETIFWMILLLLLFFQFSFVGIVKSRRPSIEV